MCKQLLTLIAALLFYSSVSAAEDVYSINDFKRSYFKIISQNSGFYKVNSKLEAQTNELPIAYGFVDRDFYTDIITASSDLKSAFVYLYHEQTGTFDRSLSIPALGGDEKIISARITYVTQASDYPNILIVSKSDSQKKLFIHAYQVTSDQNQQLSINELSNLLVSADQSGGDFVEPINFQISTDSKFTEYWLLWDAGARVAISYDRSQPNSAVNRIPFTDLLDATCTGCQDFTNIVKNRLFSAGTHTFIDLNGDGRADLALEAVDGSGARSLELFIFQNSGKFGYSRSIPINADYTMGTFVDIQERQVLDLVFWNKKDNKLYIHQGSKPQTEGANLSFPSLETQGQAVPIVLDLVPGARIQENAALNVYGVVRFADFNLDGFQDLIINTIDSDGSSNVHVFQNVACGGTDPTCRTFTAEFEQKAIGVLKGKSAVQSSLFDFGERGFVN